ncbi:retrovirus-related pol polyprotein from transposon TNT 1-94, partial [Tanacetum coccineum]
MKVEESLNVALDESPPPTKLSPLVDDDVGEEEAIENNTKVVNNSNKEDESIEVDNVVNIKESKNHPLEQVVANDVWDLVPLPMSQTVIATKWVFRNKLDKNGIVSKNKARLVTQGYNQQEGIDYDETYALVARFSYVIGFNIIRGYEPDSLEAAPAPPDYVPGPEEPEQVPPSPDYVPGLEYPEYLALADDEIVAEDQPYVDYASHVALSPGYVADSDPEEDSKDGPVDYPADEGDDDDDDDSSNDDEEEEEASKEEEHLAPADSVITPAVDLVPSSEETEPFEMDESSTTPPPPADHTTPLGARISIRPQEPMPFPSEAEVERLLALPTPPSSPLILLSPPSAEERLARFLAAPALPSSPLPIVPHPYGNPNHVCAPRGFRAAMGRLRASSPSTHHLLHPPLQPLPSSLYLPPPVPISSPLLSPPLPPLPTSLFIPPPVDHKEDIPKVELPPHKRLCLTTLTSRYEVGESSTAARLTGGHRADYGFIGTLD